jgi:hypothetical protein
VGALVAVVDPGRLFNLVRGEDGRSIAEATRPAGWTPETDQGQEDEFVVPVGGGKPFGFGSCVARKVTVRLVDPVARYTHPDGGAVTELTGDDLDRLVDTFAREHEKASPWLRGQWAHLSRALRMEQVDGSIVWYPPGAGWDTPHAAATADPDQRVRLEEQFDRPFAFFRQSIGWRRAGGDADPQPLLELPRIDAAEQSLPIVPDKERS